MDIKEKEAIEKQFERNLELLVREKFPLTATAIVAAEQPMILLFKELIHRIEKREYELDKKEKIINEMAKSNVKLKGYEIQDEYVKNTIRFFTKKVENDERKRQANKIVKAEGHGQSECYECKKQGKYSLNWTSFLYRIKKDNYEHLYCYECAKKLEGVNND